MMKHPQMLGLAVMNVFDRRIVAEGDDLDPLQPHDTIGLGPAPVVADAHADDRIKRPPDVEAFIADVEVPFFEMLKGRIRQMLGMAGQMDLAIAADDPAVALDQDGRVVMARLALLLCKLGIAEVKPDSQFLGQIEQWPGFGIGHLALEEAIDFGLVGHPPARKKCGQRQFRKHDKPRAAAMRLAQHRHQPLDYRSAVVGQMDRPQLGDGGSEFTGHHGSSGMGGRSAADHIAAMRSGNLGLATADHGTGQLPGVSHRGGVGSVLVDTAGEFSPPPSVLPVTVTL